MLLILCAILIPQFVQKVKILGSPKFIVGKLDPPCHQIYDCVSVVLSLESIRPFEHSTDLVVKSFNDSRIYSCQTQAYNGR